jgi:hypothetical protein
VTPIVLLTELKKFVEENTADIILSVRPVKNKTLPPRPKGGATPPDAAAEVTQRAAEVHLMRLPDKDAETNRIPYILLQYITGKDTHEPGEREDSVSNVRIVIATYSDNDSEGAMDVLNVITRIRNALLAAGEVGEQFLLRKPLEYLVYPDDTQPYFFGEMMSVWEMPTIIREVHTHYADE